jgi:hypothetical protein
MSSSDKAVVAFAFVTVLTLALVAATVVLFSRARRGVRASGAEGLVSRADSQRYLAENWALVEESARESGMSDDEIARVRAKILGIG